MSPKSNKAKNNKSSKKRNAKRSTKVKRYPIAYTTLRVPSLKTVSSKNNGREMILEGTDMVIPAPTTQITSQIQTQLFMQIPANPMYWTGCRIAGIAGVYQNYRPLKFEVEYIPQVPVTVPGQVTLGTYFNVTAPTSNMQQSLLTSNGGKMVQCYERCISKVLCNKKTLPLDMYNMRNSLEQNTSNPFTWFAHYSGGTVDGRIPGYVFVRWKYLFSDPIGLTGESTVAETQTTQEQAERSNTLPGWGVAISLLKSGIIPILKRVAVIFLNEVIGSLQNGITNSETVPIYPGAVMAVDVTSIDSQGTIRVKDDQGNLYQIPDDTRVGIYESGPVIRKAAAPTIELVNISNTAAYQMSRDEPGTLLYLTYNDTTVATFKLLFLDYFQIICMTIGDTSFRLYIGAQMSDETTTSPFINARFTDTDQSIIFQSFVGFTKLKEWFMALPVLTTQDMGNVMVPNLPQKVMLEPQKHVVGYEKPDLQVMTSTVLRPQGFCPP